MSADSTRARANDAVSEVLRRIPEALAVEVLRLPVPPSVEDRPGATPALRGYAEAARTMNTGSDSFTENFLAFAEQSGDYVSALEVVAFHQPLAAATERLDLSVVEFSSDEFDRWLEQTAPNQMSVLTSRVQTTRGLQHLPLLDLKLHRSSANDPVAVSVAARLGGGTVINSGSSYHVYGHRLRSHDEFLSWLLRAQLLSRVVDTRWVTHQLMEGRAALRLSCGGGKQVWPTELASVAGSDAAAR